MRLLKAVFSPRRTVSTTSPDPRISLAGGAGSKSLGRSGTGAHGARSRTVTPDDQRTISLPTGSFVVHVIGVVAGVIKEPGGGIHSNRTGANVRHRILNR